MAIPASVSLGSVTFFSNQNSFHIGTSIAQKSMKGIETFEEGVITTGDKLPFPNSLEHGVPRGPFANGIDATNLIIQSNITPGACPPTPNPSQSLSALFAVGPMFFSANSIKVGEDEFIDNIRASLDLIFTTDDKTAVGFDLSRFDGFSMAGWTICVYDLNDNVMGMHTVAGPVPTESTKVFFGVIATTPIGRINIHDNSQFPAPDAVDNIEMWTAIPTPGAVALLGIGGLVGLRRRR